MNDLIINVKEQLDADVILASHITFIIVYLFIVWYTSKRVIFGVLHKIISAWEYSNYNILKRMRKFKYGNGYKSKCRAS